MQKIALSLTFILLFTPAIYAAYDCTPSSDHQGDSTTNNCGFFSNTLIKRGSYIVK